MNKIIGFRVKAYNFRQLDFTEQKKISEFLMGAATLSKLPQLPKLNMRSIRADVATTKTLEDLWPQFANNAKKTKMVKKIINGKEVQREEPVYPLKENFRIIFGNSKTRLLQEIGGEGISAFFGAEENIKVFDELPIPDFLIHYIEEEREVKIPAAAPPTIEKPQPSPKYLELEAMGIKIGNGVQINNRTIQRLKDAYDDCKKRKPDFTFNISLGNNVILGDEVFFVGVEIKIGNETQIENSIIWGGVEIGKKVKLDSSYGKVFLGDGVKIGDNTTILGPIEIDSNASLGSNVSIGVHTKISDKEANKVSKINRKIKIGNNVQIGRNVIISKDVKDGAVIKDGTEY